MENKKTKIDRIKEKKKQEEIRRKKLLIRNIVLLCLVVETMYMIVTIPIFISGGSKKQKEQQVVTNTVQENTIEASANNLSYEIDDWKLTVANRYHAIPESYQIELTTIEGDLQFDKRAIGELNDLRKAVGKAGYSNLWIQSAYRSIELQKTLFNNKVQEYIEQGNNQEKAEELAHLLVNRPGESDHNLGLAVDFNYVNEGFEKLPVYTWLCENAQNYGFILRYPEEKQGITGVSYEPWHWRYVGKENAIEMKEKGYCLEEYVSVLNIQKQQ